MDAGKEWKKLNWLSRWPTKNKEESEGVEGEYEYERIEMMCVILIEMEREMNEVIERTGREWMVLLVGLWGGEYKDDWRGERVSGENVVCEI